MKAEITPNIKCKNLISLWFVEINQRFIDKVIKNKRFFSIFLINNIV